MAHQIDITRAEEVLRRHFEHRELLAQALQAPEKLQDRDTKAILEAHDGNRGLAQLGQAVLEMVLIDEGCDAGYTRGDVSNLKNRLAGHKYLAQIARYTGLDVCVKTSERQRTASLPDGTLKAATVAVIGAVWRDSNRNFDETLAAIRNLGISSMVDEAEGIKIVID